MQCRADGCEREAHYKEACLCQKHYFRQWRYGTTNLTRKKARPRCETPDGYQWIHSPGHPLAHRNGYVAEHRAVLYADLGEAPIACKLCGTPLTWKTCHVDHIDNDVKNNVLANLRPTCCSCNTWRGISDPVHWQRTHKIEYAGTTLTPHEWSRDPRVSVSGSTIRRRWLSGMTAEQALFGPKVTHQSVKAKKPAQTKQSARRLQQASLQE